MQSRMLQLAGNLAAVQNLCFYPLYASSHFCYARLVYGRLRQPCPAIFRR